jgi:Flp pilus assembly protein TadD
VWFLLQLALMYLLFVRITAITRALGEGLWLRVEGSTKTDQFAPSTLNSQPSTNQWLALFAVAWYGLHPAMAETINYIVQRADLFPALGVVASLLIYASWPGGRKWGLYLLPVVVSSFAKPTGMVFPAILFVYHLLFEPSSEDSPFAPSHMRRTVWACIPSLVVCLALAVFTKAMTPMTYTTGTSESIPYLLTQPIVLLHYFSQFFVPTSLTADTDWKPVAGVFTDGFLIGFLFLAALVIVVGCCCRNRELRPVAFGLSWFLLASLPTSLIPLAEVENDHRMFFPFVGLVLAVCTAIVVGLDRYRERLAGSSGLRAAVAAGAVCVLATSAYGTRLRNEVWRTDEALWKDVTLKSPHNGRGLMNYGRTLMARGDAQSAYNYFQRAAVYTPNYSTLEINMGLCAGELHRDAEAEQHFRRAIALAPGESRPYSYYGGWLQRHGRLPDAVSALSKGAAVNATDLSPRYTLMQAYSQQSDWDHLQQTANEVLRLAPGDAEAQRYLQMAQKPPQTPEAYLNESLRHFQQQRYDDCIRAARQALRLRPGYAEAYNNIAAGYQSQHHWDEAIAAAKEALRLKPDFPLARNNLNYSLSQKAHGGLRADGRSLMDRQRRARSDHQPLTINPQPSVKPQKSAANLHFTVIGRRTRGDRA